VSADSFGERKYGGKMVAMLARDNSTIHLIGTVGS